MKKSNLAILAFTSPTFVACATSSPWVGIPPAERSD